MTSRERFLKVLNGEKPDRVPVNLFFTDQGHFISQLYPDIEQRDYDLIRLKIIEFQKQLGADVFLRITYDKCYPIHVLYGGADTSQETENWEIQTEDLHNGNTLIKRTTIKTPDGVLTQDFSINELRKGTYMYSCTKKPIKNPDDLEIMIKYEPKMEKSFRFNIRNMLGDIKRTIADDGIVGMWVPHGPFNNASMLIEQEELYTLFLTDYEYYEKLMNFSMDRTIDYTREIIDAGADALCVSGNAPGGFLGKRIYDKYVLPFEKKYINFCQQNGTPAIYHNCGQIMNLIESYKELGARVIEPFSPPPLGDADLIKAKEIVNGAYIMISGVDQVNILQNGTVEKVKKITQETMEIGKQGGNFICQNVDFLEYGTPVENVEAFVKTAVENAWY